MLVVDADGNVHVDILCYLIHLSRFNKRYIPFLRKIFIDKVTLLPIYLWPIAINYIYCLAL